MSAQPLEQASDPGSLRFANRATGLLAAHPWLDSQTAVTLAQQPTGDDQMHAQAAAMGQQLAQSWDGYEHSFYDPVLQTQPSQSQAQVAYVHQTLGPAPATTGISDLQTALNQDGFLKTAPSGVWDAETENAYNQAVNALRNGEYAGAPHKGGNPFTSKVSALYHAVINTATHPWDAATEWYDGVRQAVGDFSGAAAGLGAAVVHGQLLHGPEGYQVAGSVSQHVINALGGHTTQQSQIKELSNPLNAVADAASIAVAGGVAKGAAKGVVDQTLKRSAQQALENGVSEADLTKLQKVGLAMSTAQRMGFTQRSINDIGNALRAGTLPASDPLVKRNLGVIAKTLLKTPAALTGPVRPEFSTLVSPSWKDNLPSLARLAPVAQKIASGADEGGWAYNIRNLGGFSPYRNPVIRAAGIATQRAQIGALGAHGLANLFPGTTLANTVDAPQHNPLDSWIANTTWNPIPGVTLDPSMFLLGPLHGDLVGAGRASRVIGDASDTFLNNLADSLGRTGVIAAFEHSTGMSYQQMLQSVGGDSVGLQTWMRDHQAQAAQDAYVVRQLGHPVTLPSADEEGQIGAAENAWYKMDDGQKAAWLADYTKADTHLQYLRNHLDSSFLSDSISKEARQAATKTNLKDYIQMQNLGQQLMRSGAGKYIIGPKGAGMLRDDKEMRSFGGDLEEGLPYQRPVAPNGIQRSGLVPPFTRQDYVRTGMGHATAIRKGIDSALKVSAKRLSDAEQAAKTATGRAQRGGAASALKLAREAHENALMSVGRTPQAAIDRAQETVDQLQQTLSEAQGVGGAQEIAAYQTRLAAAEKRLAKVKASTRNMNLRGLMQHTYGSPDATRASKARLEALKQHQSALAEHISGGVLPEQLGQEVRNSINGKSRFDELYTHQYGPEQALPPDFGTGDYMARLNPEQPGAFGWQKITSKTRGDVNDDATGFLDRALAAKGNQIGDLHDELVNYFATHFNMDASRLATLPMNNQKLIQLIRERAESLASDTLPTPDQPKWVADLLAQAKAKGYKLVVGSHIGHALDDSLPDLGPIDGHLTAMRRYIGKVGLDPARVPDSQVSIALRNNIMSKVHAIIRDDPKVQLSTLHADVRTFMAVMQHGVANELSPVERALFNLTSNVGFRGLESGNRTEIRRLAATKYAGQTDAVMKARQEVEHTMAQQMGLRDINHKAALKALTETHDITMPGGSTFTWHAVDTYTAERLLAGVNDGYRLPGYMMGWSAIEDWARAGFGIGSKLIARDPDKPLYRAVALWPNKLVQARNKLRFTISPLFAERKNVKQDFKMSLELGRPVTVSNPLHDLEKNGEVEQAQKLWGKVSGLRPGSEMEGDLYLRSRDVFGIYSPQWKGAWFVNELSKRGDSSAEMKEAYNRVFKYGSAGGMTAAERTANTIFFPFSFEKTLLRNTGAYLADKPGQALVLDLAVEEWRQADKNGQIGQWVQDHLPILREMQLLNGFALGISLGQFGGINANAINMGIGGSEALLNLFLPQSWGPNYNKANLKKFLPIWGEFANLWSDSKQQANVAGAAAHDAIRSMIKPGWRDEPVLTDKAQTSYALRTKASWVSNPAIRAVIDYDNAQTNDADKYLWPEDKNVPVDIWGKPVNKSTITDYIEYLYPAYNPDAGAAYAKDEAQALTRFIHTVGETDPAKAQQMAQFRAVADSVVSHINGDQYDSATEAQTQTQFMQGAAQLAKGDKDWANLYNNFYAWALGPIRTPAQKAGAK